MIKIEYPSDRNDIGLALSKALNEIHNNVPTLTVDPKVPTELVKDVGSVGTAGAVSAPGSAEPITPPADSPASVRIDANGVGYNDIYCGKATEPFYNSGAREGQWKKRRGVDDREYDAWYRSELAKDTDAPIDTANAFNPAPQQTQTPENMGELMKWVSEHQTAGHITQDHVNEAYRTAGLQLADMFSGSPEEIKTRIATLYTSLSRYVQ